MIRKALEEELVNLRRSTGGFPAGDRRHYAQWLAQTYYFVCHSTRLLTAAATRFTQAQQALHLRFIDHMREERGHELLALRDLQAMGMRIEDFPELPSTQAFYQTQYYWIEHVSPISLYGYILALEAFAIGDGTRIYEQARGAHGEKSTVFLKVHVKEDVEHVEKAFEQLEKLSPEEQSIIARNLKLSAYLYARMYEQIQAVEAGTPAIARAA